METEKRTTGYVKLYTKEQMQRIKEYKCPICNLHKDQWKRRKDWTCCSKECTNEFSKLFTSWQFFKVKAFERDKWTCVKCGYKSVKKIEFNDEKKKWYLTFDKFKEEIEQYKNYYNLEYWDGETAICHTTEDLIGDHITPIATGGDEYDLDNIQTLCITCNKKKTKEDMQKIALYRKQNPEQLILNLEVKQEAMQSEARHSSQP